MKLIDFEKLRVGDDVWSIAAGWTKVEYLHNHDRTYRVRTEDNVSYTVDGFLHHSDKAPSLFLEPPEGFDTLYPSCEFKEGDKVLVRDTKSQAWLRRYFYMYEPGEDRKYRCFVFGDEWSSAGETNSWKYCRKPTDGELEGLYSCLRN